MMFYAFAMQCASTVAVVYRETKNWRWPAISVCLYDGAGLCGQFDYLSSFEVTIFQQRPIEIAVKVPA